MGFFDFLKQANINQGIEEYKRTGGAVLLDVRTPQEYQEGHIPESKNVPLQQLNNVVSVAKNTEIPLFVVLPQLSVIIVISHVPQLCFKQLPATSSIHCTFYHF